MNWYVKSKKEERIFGPYTKEVIAKRIVKEDMGNYVFSQDKVQWLEKLPISNAKILGKYKVLRELGRGGMGVVYHAIDTSLNRECALKLLVHDKNEAAVERFFNEARAIAQINHPGIIKIHEIHSQPRHFFTMEYIPGQTLGVYLSTRQFELSEKLRLFAKICDATAHAHKHKILHRDLKPNNILIRKDGSPILLDFGIAKDAKTTSNLTQKGEIIGTPRYVAPEVVMEEPIDERSDVYSLGVILYQMLTGRPPFDVDNFFSLVHVLTTKEPLPPSQLNNSIAKNSDIEILCLKSLEKKPVKRIKSAQFLRDEVHKILEGKPVALRKPTILEQIVRWYRGNGLVGRIVLMLMVATVILSVTTFFAFQAVNEAQIAKKEALKTIAVVQQKKKEANDTIIEIAQRVPQIMRLGQLQQALGNLQRAFIALDDSFAERTKSQNTEIFRRLNNILKFSVLTNLPEVRQANIENLSLNISQGGRFLWLMKDRFLYLWNTDKNSDKIHIDNGKKIELGVVTQIKFSHDDSFVMFRDGNYIYLLDMSTNKRVIIDAHGGSYEMCLSDNSRFLAYGKGGNSICVYDIKRRKKISQFTMKKPLEIKIANDGLSVAVLGDESFHVYSVRDARLHSINDSNSFSFGCKFVFDKERYLYMISAFGLTIYDCHNYTKKYTANPYSSHFIKAEPITVHERLVFGTDQGNILTYFRENQLRPHRFVMFPTYFREEVFQFLPTENFVCVVKGPLLQLRNVLSMETIFSERYEGHQVNLQQNANGYTLQTFTMDKYTNYKFYAKTLLCSEQLSKTLRKLYYVSDELKQVMRRIEVPNNDVILLSHQLGYLGWCEGKFSMQYSIKKGMPLSVTHNKSKIAITYDDANIDILSAKDLSVEKQISFSKIKSTFQNEPRQTCFLDDDNIFIVTTKGELCRYNISQDIYRSLSQRIHLKAIFSKRVNDIIFLGTKHGFAIFDMKKNKLDDYPLYDRATLNCFNVSKTGELLACGSLLGEIEIWGTDPKPHKIKSIHVPGSVDRISFSPNGEYLAIFTSDNFFIYDLKLNQLLEAYTGYFKNNVSNISDDWSHIYFPVDVGDIIIFDQSYFFNKNKQQQKIMAYNVANDQYNTKVFSDVLKRLYRKLAK